MRLSVIGIVADSRLRELSGHYLNVSVDEHIVMPNHIHAIIMIDGEHSFTPNPKVPVECKVCEPPRAGSLSAIIRSYKAGVTLRSRELGFHQEIWQARFHDHLLRGDKVMGAAREYIRSNPANWAKDKDHRP